MNILITFSLSSGPRPFFYALLPLSAGFHQHGRLLRLPDAGDMFDEVLQHEYEMFYTLRDLRVRVEPFHKVHLSRLFYLLIRLMMGCVWMPPLRRKRNIHPLAENSLLKMKKMQLRLLYYL